MNFYRSHSLSFNRILYGIRHANPRPGPALSGLTLSGGPTPCIEYQNRSTVVAVTTAHYRHFSASGLHNEKSNKSVKEPSKTQAKKSGKKSAKKSEKARGPVNRYKWASRLVSNDVYDALESHILDDNRRTSERFPAMPATLKSDIPKPQRPLPDTLNPYNPERETPPSTLGRLDGMDGLDGLDSPHPRTTYKALVIDCEMVAMKGGERGLISITVLDFFTGTIVLHNLVRPTGIVTDWRRDVTGFNKKSLAEARNKGKMVLSGWRQVRDMIFDVANSETIFIGHALANDLRVLRIATDRVVDSMVMMSLAVFKGAKPSRDWGLKTASKDLLNVEVQKACVPHDSLEDALAARELVVQCVLHPEKLAERAADQHVKRAQLLHLKKAKEAAKKEKEMVRKVKKKEKERVKKAAQAATNSETVMEEKEGEGEETGSEDCAGRNEASRDGEEIEKT